MVGSLDKELVAEDVETKEQVDLLESYGCKYALGFQISKSVALDKLCVCKKIAILSALI